jgi:hypothetical protein
MFYSSPKYYLFKNLILTQFMWNYTIKSGDLNKHHIQFSSKDILGGYERKNKRKSLHITDN